MKNQNSIYFALVIILTTSLACNIGGTAPATPVASQEAVDIDGPPGPETIDAANPALYTVLNAPAYKIETTIKYTGVDTNGGAKEETHFTAVETQTQPQITQHHLFEGDALNMEKVIIGDQLYTVIKGFPCTTSHVSSVQGQNLLDSTLKSMPNLRGNFTEQARRVESGVEVNGFVTDKYELSNEHIVVETGKLIPTFVCVARKGGFITRFEQQEQSKISGTGFDPKQFIDITRISNYIPVEDGSLNISIPVECNK